LQGHAIRIWLYIFQHGIYVSIAAHGVAATLVALSALMHTVLEAEHYRDERARFEAKLQQQIQERYGSFEFSIFGSISRHFWVHFSRCSQLHATHTRRVTCSTSCVFVFASHADWWLRSGGMADTHLQADPAAAAQHRRRCGVPSLSLITR